MPSAPPRTASCSSKSERLTEELGERAVDLLVQEPDVQQAREIHARISRLVHYYRTTESGLPAWTRRFITTGYSHYSTLLPNAFADRGVNPADLAAMLQFIFTLESLALSLGCERSQLVIAVRQVAPGHDRPAQARAALVGRVRAAAPGPGEPPQPLRRTDRQRAAAPHPAGLPGRILARAGVHADGRRA